MDSSAGLKAGLDGFNSLFDTIEARQLRLQGAAEAAMKLEKGGLTPAQVKMLATDDAFRAEVAIVVQRNAREREAEAQRNAGIEARAGRATSMSDPALIARMSAELASLRQEQRAATIGGDMPPLIGCRLPSTGWRGRSTPQPGSPLRPHRKGLRTGR